MAGNPEGEGRAQLLDDIEAFSRNGPPVPEERPAQPAIARDKLVFPDLTRPPPARQGVETGPLAGSRGRAPPGGGGLLDRLRQQAQATQRQAVKHDADAQMRALHLSASIEAAFGYFDDMVCQLEIIQPAIPADFELPGKIVFAQMNWQAGAADFRLRPTATEDRHYETASVRFRFGAPQRLQEMRDAAGVEPLRKLLHDAGIAFRLDERRSRDSLLEGGLFSFPCEVRGGFLFKADYPANELTLRTRNLGRFGTMEFRLQAGDLTHETLDDLAQLMLCQPSRFLKRFRRSA
ncbi:MAG: hypothetical protein KGZ43_10480 [Sulfuritalea sp.]|nr:hypothetical protein [Sulfuritalea sp.]